MAIAQAISHDKRFLVVWFEGRITQCELMASLRRTRAMLPKGGEFASLIVVDSGTDISELDHTVLRTLQDGYAEVLSQLGARRRAGAGLVPRHSDAPHLVRLWNAFSDLEGRSLSFELFENLDDALAYLGVSAAVANEVMGQRPAL